MDIPSAFGYLSGLYLIKSGMDPMTLFRTALVVQGLDAILCRIFAAQNGRHKTLWTLAGLLFGAWALGVLFLLPNHKK